MEFVDFGSFTEKLTALEGSAKRADEKLRALEDELLADPEAGDLVPGGGGIRKIRMAIRDRGKRDGARVIYYLQISRDIIFFLDIYPKSMKENLSPREVRELGALAKFLKDQPE